MMACRLAPSRACRYPRLVAGVLLSLSQGAAEGAGLKRQSSQSSFSRHPAHSSFEWAHSGEVGCIPSPAEFRCTLHEGGRSPSHPSQHFSSNQINHVHRLFLPACVADEEGGRAEEKRTREVAGEIRLEGSQMKVPGSVFGRVNRTGAKKGEKRSRACTQRFKGGAVRARAEQRSDRGLDWGDGAADWQMSRTSGGACYHKVR